jgi:integral membrane protein (TIGR00529 family)
VLISVIVYALISIVISLAALVALLRLKVKIGVAMLVSACLLAVLLRVWPADLAQTLAEEWRRQPLTRTTGYLFVSLTLLMLLVNVIGSAMEEIGLSQRLVPAMQGLFKSRRFALALMPLLMGMLPTPGGIMLSAPMVREAGDKMGVERSHLAAINFLFRHVWEPVWPLFPVVPFIQGMLGVSALTLFCYHVALAAAGILIGTVMLLMFGIPPRRAEQEPPRRHVGHHLKDFLHAFWPIVLTAGLYIAFDVPPAVGIFIAIIGLLLMHRVPPARWRFVFRAAREPDLVLLIFGALFFKINLESSGAIASVVEFLTSVHVPPPVLIFLLPMLVSFTTGVTMPTVAITYPFFLAFMGTGPDTRMGLEALAFSGLLFGLWLTPVHLCLPLSASYFQTSLLKIIWKLVLPTAGVAVAGALLAVLFG